MDRFETELEIDQPPSRVFEFLVDQENKPLWISDFFKTEQIHGEQGESGSVARQIFVQGNRHISYLEKIAESLPGTLLDCHLSNEIADFHIRSEMQSKESGQSTFLKVVVEYIPKSFMAKIRNVLQPNWLREKYTKDLTNLKEAVEAMSEM